MKLHRLTSPTSNCQVKAIQCTTRDNKSLSTMKENIGKRHFMIDKNITIFIHEFDKKHNKSFSLRRKGGFSRTPILCETLTKENGEPLNILMCS